MIARIGAILFLVLALLFAFVLIATDEETPAQSELLMAAAFSSFFFALLFGAFAEIKADLQATRSLLSRALAAHARSLMPTAPPPPANADAFTYIFDIVGRDITSGFDTNISVQAHDAEEAKYIAFERGVEVKGVRRR